jgi:Xaa-Pro aminopeptidase
MKVTHFKVKERLNRLRERMRHEGIDAFVALRSVSVEYLTGFDHIRDLEDPHAVLVTADEARFISDARYLEAIQAQVAEQNSPYQVDNPQGKSIPKDLCELWDLNSYKAIALEDTVMQRIFALFEEALVPVALTPAKNWVEDLRRTKDATELERIAVAQSITDQAFEHICSYLQVGQTEQEIALELEYTLRKLGADALAFPSIVASGPNGSLPHAVPSDRRIEASDFVTLDFGAAYRGYCSDMTRTVCVGGQPTDEQRRVYETVREAQLASLTAYKEGVTGTDADKAGRDIIEAAGYGAYFAHGTGHGVGLEIHEQPSVSPRGMDALQKGEVVTCEPGIYIPGKLGVRIEDMVAIEANNGRSSVHNFTTSTKELLVL